MALVKGTAKRDLLKGFATSDTLAGLAGNDDLTGLAGNDLLDGGTGADKMIGGTGNDTYIVDIAGDRTIESASQGIDTVKASVTHTLLANVENLILTGSRVINGTGNGLANTITGNAVTNILKGGAGADTLNGGGGNDTLSGDAGIDRLNGGAGTDTALFGGNSGGYTAVAGAGGLQIYLNGHSADRDIVAADVELLKFADGYFSKVAKSLTLTTGTNSGAAFNGSVFNDTYAASYNFDDTALQTLNGTDKLNGGTGAGDVLNLSLGGEFGGAFDGGTLANIEIVNITNGAGQNLTTIDAAHWTGVKTISVSQSYGSATEVNHLHALATADIAFSGDTRFIYADGVLAGANDTQKVLLTGSGAGGFFRAGNASGTEIAENLSIVSTGAAHVLEVDGSKGHRAITVGGNSHLTLNVVDHLATLASISAAGMTGGGLEVIGLGGFAGNLTVTGSAFDDEVYFVADTLSSGDTISGGLGQDALAFGSVGTIDLFDMDFLRVSSVETLEIANDYLTASFDMLAMSSGIRTIEALGTAKIELSIGANFTVNLLVDLDATDATNAVAADAADTVNGSAMGGALTVSALANHINILDLFIGGASAADTLRVVADGNNSGATIGGNVTGFERIVVEAGAAGAGATINVTGGVLVSDNQTFTVDASALASDAAFNFNGTGETGGLGKFNVTGGAGADHIIGGAGGDVISGGAGNDNLGGGLGLDTITAGTGADIVTVVGTLAGYGMNDGNDTITLGDDTDVDQIYFDMNAVSAGVSTVTDFDAGTNATAEDKVTVNVNTSNAGPTAG